jgi:flavodoxin
MKRLLFLMLVISAVLTTSARSLVVYTSRTGNTTTVAKAVHSQLNCDIIQIEPVTAYYADYDSMLNRAKSEIADIDNNGTYPSIKSVSSTFASYSDIFICTPLWWSRMCTTMQSFLHAYADSLAGKNIHLAVTSASSGISTVVADAKRLLPESKFNDNNLWVKNSQTSSASSLVSKWIDELGVSADTAQTYDMTILVNGYTVTAQMVANSSTDSLRHILMQDDITYEAHDYGNFEKVGDIGHTLPQNNEQITTVPGDIILYQGNNICLYYDTNQWNFTRLGKITDLTQTQLKTILKAGAGNVTVTLSLKNSGLSDVNLTPSGHGKAQLLPPYAIYTLDGRQLSPHATTLKNLPGGIYIINHSKVKIQ